MKRTITLRVFTKDDAPRLAEIANNKRVFDYLRDGFPFPYTIEHAKKYIDDCLAITPPTRFAVEYNGIYVGNIGLHPGEDVYRKTAEIGYFIDEAYWNKGIATQTIAQITQYGFKNLDINRIYAGVFAYNLPSKSVLEKCGYSHECTAKAAVYKNGAFWDEHRYAILNSNESYS